MENAQTLIHVRFAPDGSVTEIGERPPAQTAQDWFDRLSLEAADDYQALSGGRGMFRMSPEKVEAVRTLSVN